MTTFGPQFMSHVPKYQQLSSAHPSDPSPEISHPHEMEWDEAKFQSSWGQHDMASQPDIPTVKITGGVGNRRPMDKYGD